MIRNDTVVIPPARPHVQSILFIAAINDAYFRSSAAAGTKRAKIKL
jgi:hypothetical protein